ncbi:hypothetical protein MHB44_13425 [Lysinibacillus sp. FSL H8-0500]|uniref:Thioredoxin domain-containing protein n=1 Tax=Lysinibacillus macroides TaxID=33935 RepID=A0A0M9DM87_9BACI|nr:hypothetical protein [Lysinibacillus macroides]KOY83250.1 hypothetical protein ADM90_08215 [Lysinibacillus macroides]QPR69112.1 hypothetical protein I6G82_05725 [Lysinibacillus macroides]
MEMSFVDFILIFVFIFSYFYTYYSLANNHKFLKNIVKSDKYNLDLEGYEGYIIVGSKETYINDISLFKIINQKLSSERSCLLLDISLADRDTMFDLNILEKLSLNTIPSILYFQDGKVTEIINFAEFDDATSLIKKIINFHDRKEIMNG